MKVAPEGAAAAAANSRNPKMVMTLMMGGWPVSIEEGNPS